MTLASSLNTALIAAYGTEWSALRRDLAVTDLVPHTYLDEGGALCVRASCVGIVAALAPKLALTTRVAAASYSTLTALRDLVTKGILDPSALRDGGATVVSNGA